MVRLALSCDYTQTDRAVDPVFRPDRVFFETIVWSSLIRDNMEVP